MKKVFLGIGLLLLLLIGFLIAVPFLFKDQIKAALDKQIANSVNAKVLYKPENVDLTVFRSFPSLTLGIDDLTIIGQDSFARDTLARLPSLDLNLDIMSVISGDQIKVNSIELDKPRIKLVMLKSGLANWDIMKPDTVPTPADTAKSKLKLALEGWTIDDGYLVYDDRSLPMVMTLNHIDHTGKGDFEQDVFDMTSQTKAQQMTVNYGGMRYLTNATLDADVTMGIDLAKSVYAFKENQIKVNDFAFGVDGNITMPAEDIGMDMKFHAKETDFKNLLSIVPGMYTKEFENIKTSGKLAFDGFVKGVMSETTMPGYGLNLKVNNAMFKYPSLPQAAENITIDMSLNNPTGVTNDLAVDLRKLHLDLGKNPVDARMVLKGLEPMDLDGNVKANLNLTELTKVFPLDGMTLRGLLFVDANAKGTYSKTQMPVVNAKMNLSNGYVKTKDFPAPIENLSMNGTVANATGNVNDTQLKIEQFKMLFDGEPLEGRVYVQNLQSPKYDADIRGTVDLTKLTKMFPQEGMTVSGRIKADIKTKGNMADIEAGKYSNITSGGTMQMSNIAFKSTDLPQGMKVTDAGMRFNNEFIEVNSMSGSLGKSPVTATGKLSNYMGYLFGDKQDLRGTLNVSSSRFDVNEWMVEEPVGTAEPAKVPNPDGGTAASTADGVVPVPEYLDLTMNMSANEVLYDNLNLSNVKGVILVKNEIAKLQNVSFNTLGGTFGIAGAYNTQDLSHPKFDFDLNIKELDFKRAFESFNTVKTFVPIAKFLEGKFSTNFAFSGELGQDMMPVYSSLSGKGLVDVVRAVVRNVPVISKMSSLTQLNELKEFVVENRKFDAQIVNGNLVVKPFDINVGKDMKLTVGGQNAYTGGINYLAGLELPTGKIGSSLNNQLAGIKGLSNVKAAERVTLNFDIGGTLTNPKVGLKGGDLKGQMKDMVKDAVKDAVNTKVDEGKARLEAEKKAAEDRARQELEKRKQEAEQKARDEIEKQKKAAEQKAKDAAGNAAKDKLKDIFKKP